MPLDSNYTLHTWIKYYDHDPSTDRMPDEPHKHDLLGFPRVKAEDPKVYIRKLWLVAENDRILKPKFLDPGVVELADCVNKMVNTYVKDDDKRHKELCDGAFLEKDAVHILHFLGFGLRIWGEGSGADTRLESDYYPRPPPRWGVDTDSGYEKNDEDDIQLYLRYWMAARIQANINAPCKEKKRAPSVTVEHSEQLLPESSSQSRPQRSELAQQEGPSDTSELPPPCLEQRRYPSAAMVEENQEADRSRSKGRARSDGSPDSDGSLSFTSFMHVYSDSEAAFLRSRISRSKRPRVDIAERLSHTRSPRSTTEVTSTVGANMPSEASTEFTIPDMGDNNTNVEDDLFKTKQTKQKLQLNLTRFLKNQPDYAGILREVIPPTRQLYANSSHRQPYSDLEFEFRNFNRALDHWESLITRVTASAGVTQSLVKDPLPELAAQKTFEERVAMLHNFGPRSHVDFPLERWTISLALFFEGLLGDTYMPFPFKDLVLKLRVANQSLYDTIAVGSIRSSGGKDVQHVG